MPGINAVVLRELLSRDDLFNRNEP